MMNQQVLLLIGAPKCGTSSAFAWLSRHPQIAGSREKETYFFVDPGHPLHGFRGSSWSEHGLDGFLDLFAAEPATRVLLEGTTHNFYQDAAIDFARSHPKVRAVFVLRDPAVRVLSHFRYARDTRAEIKPGYTFDRYVDRLLSGAVSRDRDAFRNAATYHVFNRQIDLSDYGRWIARWREEVGAGRLRLLVFEDMTTAPEAAMAGVAEWISLDKGMFYRNGLEAQNRTYKVGQPTLHRIAWAASRWLPRGAVKAGIRSVYLDLQARFAREDRDFNEGLERLTEYFAPTCTALDIAEPDLRLSEYWRREAFTAEAKASA